MSLYSINPIKVVSVGDTYKLPPNPEEGRDRCVVVYNPGESVPINGNVIVSFLNYGTPHKDWHVPVGQEYIDCWTRFPIPIKILQTQCQFIKSLPHEKIEAIHVAFTIVENIRGEI